MSKIPLYSEGIVTKQNLFEKLNAVNPETNELKNPPKPIVKKSKPKKKKKKKAKNKKSEVDHNEEENPQNIGSDDGAEGEMAEDDVNIGETSSPPGEEEKNQYISALNKETRGKTNETNTANVSLQDNEDFSCENNTVSEGLESEIKEQQPNGSPSLAQSNQDNTPTEDTTNQQDEKEANMKDETEISDDKPTPTVQAEPQKPNTIIHHTIYYVNSQFKKNRERGGVRGGSNRGGGVHRDYENTPRDSESTAPTSSYRGGRGGYRGVGRGSYNNKYKQDSTNSNSTSISRSNNNYNNRQPYSNTNQQQQATTTSDQSENINNANKINNNQNNKPINETNNKNKTNTKQYIDKQNKNNNNNNNENKKINNELSNEKNINNKNKKKNKNDKSNNEEQQNQSSNNKKDTNNTSNNRKDIKLNKNTSTLSNEQSNKQNQTLQNSNHEINSEQTLDKKSKLNKNITEKQNLEKDKSNGNNTKTNDSRININETSTNGNAQNNLEVKFNETMKNYDRVNNYRDQGKYSGHRYNRDDGNEGDSYRARSTHRYNRDNDEYKGRSDRDREYRTRSNNRNEYSHRNTNTAATGGGVSGSGRYKRDNYGDRGYSTHRTGGDREYNNERGSRKYYDNYNNDNSYRRNYQDSRHGGPNRSNSVRYSRNDQSYHSRQSNYNTKPVLQQNGHHSSDEENFKTNNGISSDKDLNNSLRKENFPPLVNGNSDNTRDAMGKLKKWSDKCWQDEQQQEQQQQEKKVSAYEEQTNRVKVTHELRAPPLSNLSNEFFREVNGELLDAPKEYSLAICVSEDFRMQSGLAAQFRQEFKRLDILLDQNCKPGDVAFLQDKSRYIYYLVNKSRAHLKASMKSMRQCLIKLRQLCNEHGVTHLATPQLGLGNDKLDWREVKQFVIECFEHSQISVLLYKHNFHQENFKPKMKTSTAGLVFQHKPITEIEEFTSLIVFSSKDGHVNETMERLDKKFNILTDFQEQLPNTSVGSIITLERDFCYFISIFIICSQFSSNVFSFSNVAKCINLYKKHLNKDYMNFVAYEMISYENIQIGKSNNNVQNQIEVNSSKSVENQIGVISSNEIFEEKLISFLKNSFSNNIEIHICYPYSSSNTSSYIKNHL